MIHVSIRMSGQPENYPFRRILANWINISPAPNGEHLIAFGEYEGGVEIVRGIAHIEITQPYAADPPGPITPAEDRAFGERNELSRQVAWEEEHHADPFE